MSVACHRLVTHRLHVSTVIIVIIVISRAAAAAADAGGVS